MKLVLLGSGGYSNTVKDVANQLGYEIVAVLDDKLKGLELDTYIRYISSDIKFLVAFGNNELRLSWIDKLLKDGAVLATLIHPTCYISPDVQVGSGTVILPGAIVNTGVVINKGCIINIGAIIDHNTILEDGVHIAPGAIVKGENRIPKMSKIESGMVVSTREYPI